MKVLQKYILHKTSDHDEPMTQEEKEIEIDKPDGSGLFNIYLPLYKDNDNDDDSTLVPHSNQQIAQKTIELLLTDEKHGIRCLQQRGGETRRKRKTRRKKNNKKRKTRINNK